MKKEKKYLKLYEEWIKQGRIPYVNAKRTEGGLCSVFEDNELFELCKPDNDYDNADGYWGFTEDQDGHDLQDLMTIFTPLRQNIVLFLAAMNDEL